eukprot:5102924-Amphidinium_carterae.1
MEKPKKIFSRQAKTQISLECAGLAGRWAKSHADPVALDQRSCDCRSPWQPHLKELSVALTHFLEST